MRPERDANPRAVSGVCSLSPACFGALTPFPGPSSPSLACQSQPGLVWLLSSPRYHLQLCVLCLLLAEGWDTLVVSPPELCEGFLGLLALVGFPLNFWVRAAGAQNPSLSASSSGGRTWDLHVWGGGREGKFGIMCKTIKMLLTGNLKQWRVLLFLQIHELKTAANDGKC